MIPNPLYKTEGFKQLKSYGKLKSVELAKDKTLNGKPKAFCHEESIIFTELRVTSLVFIFNNAKSG